MEERGGEGRGTQNPIKASKKSRVDPTPTATMPLFIGAYEIGTQGYWRKDQAVVSSGGALYSQTGAWTLSTTLDFLATLQTLRDKVFCLAFKITEKNGSWRIL